MAFVLVATEPAEVLCSNCPGAASYAYLGRERTPRIVEPCLRPVRTPISFEPLTKNSN